MTDTSPTAWPAASVIIPAYDDSDRLRRLLWMIEQTADMPVELIVACAKQCVAKNRNAGLDRASHDLTFFMDDDVMLPPHWMSRLTAVLRSADDIGAASAHLIFPNGAPQTRRADLAPGESWEVTIPGTCFAYSRQRVGDQRFDEEYIGSQWEDTDWMWTIQRLGLRTVMTGDVQVLHDHVLKESQWLRHNGARFLGKWGKLPDADDIASVTPEAFEGWRKPELP